MDQVESSEMTKEESQPAVKGKLKRGRKLTEEQKYKNDSESKIKGLRAQLKEKKDLNAADR